MMQEIWDQAVQRSGMTSAMRMASLHADPVEKLVLLESLEELEVERKEKRDVMSDRTAIVEDAS